MLRANFCSIHSSGLHSTATLILSDGSELAGLPSLTVTKANGRRKLVLTPVSVEKLFLPKFAKIKSRQDSL